MCGSAYIDIHTHQSYTRVGVMSVLNVIIGWNNRWAELSDSNQNQYFSAGIHPWYATAEQTQQQLEQLRRLLPSPRLIAIGECGLDKLRSPLSLSEQSALFEQQIDMTEEFRKPLIIHCVRAHQELLNIYQRTKPTQNWLIHGFGKKINTFEALRQHDNIYFSFGAALLSPDNPARIALKQCNAERFMLETDNAEELMIEELYQIAAELRGCSAQELKEQLYLNFLNFSKPL